MADLGAIGKSRSPNIALFGGTVRGIVKDAAGAFAKRLVRAYHRETGAYSGAAFSNATTGAYSINTNLQYVLTEHIVVEFDDAAGDQYNARVFDRVTPI